MKELEIIKQGLIIQRNVIISKMKSSIIKAYIAAIIISIIGFIALTAIATYRYTMNHIEVQVVGDTAYLTVYGHTDRYE